MTDTVIGSETIDRGLGLEVVYPTPRQIMRRRMLRHKGFLFGGAVVVIIFVMAVLAPVLAPHDPYHQDLSLRMIPPVWQAKGIWEYPLGSEFLARLEQG